MHSAPNFWNHVDIKFYAFGIIMCRKNIDDVIREIQLTLEDTEKP